MIVNALMDLVYGLLYLLTAPINIPSMPDGVSDVLNTMLEYLGVGIGLLANWTDLGYLVLLFGLIVTVDAGILLYKMIMWFLRKIPMFGIN